MKHKLLSLNADERSVLLYCINSYRQSVRRSATEMSQALQLLHFSSKRANRLIELIYNNASFSSSVCEELEQVILAWKSFQEEGNIAVEQLEEKLTKLASK